MAVDADLVDGIAASVAEIYREAETSLVRLVARHLDADLDSPAAEQRLTTVQALRRGAQAVIASLEADSGPALRDGLARSYRHGWSNATAGLPERFFPRSGIGQAARAAARERSGTGFVEALAAALHRDFGKVTGNVLRNVEDAFRSVQAAAAARILTGAQTRRQAAQAAWQRLVDRGLMSFTDRAGRRWRLSSYVEMATRTNAQRAATTGQVDRLDSIGVNLVLVSNAPQECPKCRPFEGKILRTDAGPLEIRVEHPTRDGVMTTVEVYATLDDARSRGLFHPNCRHSVSVYLPGISKLPDRPTADPEGHKARERQREFERRIRRQKERAEATLTPEAKKAANAHVRKAQADLRDHLAAHPKLKRLRYREQPGAGNIPPRRGGPTDPAGDLGPP
ncbi:phage minor capsid protein, partial [Streptomyces parvus]